MQTGHSSHCVSCPPLPANPAAMPVHRDREKKESTVEEMEVEEQEASSSDEDDSDTSSVSEDGDSSGEPHKQMHLTGPLWSGR